MGPDQCPIRVPDHSTAEQQERERGKREEGRGVTGKRNEMGRAAVGADGCVCVLGRRGCSKVEADKRGRG